MGEKGDSKPAQELTGRSATHCCHCLAARSVTRIPNPAFQRQRVLRREPVMGKGLGHKRRLWKPPTAPRLCSTAHTVRLSTWMGWVPVITLTYSLGKGLKSDIHPETIIKLDYSLVPCSTPDQRGGRTVIFCYFLREITALSQG